MKNGGLIPWNAIAISKMFKISWRMGRHLMKGASENHLKARYDSMVEYHPISARNQSKLHQFGKKVLPGIFLGYELITVRSWKDTFYVNLECWDKNTPSNSPKAPSGRDYDFQESTLRREQTEWIQVFSEELQGESGESQTTEPKDDAEAQRDFWSIQGDFIYRHHNEPRVQLNVPKEETFPVPLKYIDVARATYRKSGRVAREMY